MVGGGVEGELVGAEGLPLPPERLESMEWSPDHGAGSPAVAAAMYLQLGR
jgi:hypothetical protein